jgi:hypothetical protein
MHVILSQRAGRRAQTKAQEANRRRWTSRPMPKLRRTGAPPSTSRRREPEDHAGERLQAPHPTRQDGSRSATCAARAKWPNRTSKLERMLHAVNSDLAFRRPDAEVCSAGFGPPDSLHEERRCRVKRGTVRRAKRRSCCRAPKFFQTKAKLYRAAESVDTALRLRRPRNKKRDFRRLWIVHINAGAHRTGSTTAR